MCFEIIDNTKIRIEDRVLSAHFLNPPMFGKFQYHIEATSDKHDHRGQRLDIHDLRNVTPESIPDGVSISIYMPDSKPGDTGLVQIHKFNGLSEIAIEIDLCYANWHHTINLANFIDAFKLELLTGVETIDQVEVHRHDVGFAVSCSAPVPPTTSFNKAYWDMEANVLSAYRACIKRCSSLSVSKNSATPTTDNSRVKWWIQNVLVPIVGSGTFVAFVAWLAAHL